MKFSFSPKKRLKCKRWIKELFAFKKTCYSKPLLAFYLPYRQAPAHQMLCSISKKYVKKAVVRNKIRRRIREAYRKLQGIIAFNDEGGVLLAFVYRGTTPEDRHYETLEKAVRKILEQISKKVSK